MYYLACLSFILSGLNISIFGMFIVSYIDKKRKNKNV